MSENAHLVEKTHELAGTAKSVLLNTQAFQEARMMAKQKRGQRVAGTDAMAMGNTLLSQLMAKSSMMEGEQKNDMKSKARAVLADMEGIAGDSALLSSGLSKAKQMLEKAKVRAQPPRPFAHNQPNHTAPSFPTFLIASLVLLCLLSMFRTDDYIPLLSRAVPPIPGGRRRGR